MTITIILANAKIISSVTTFFNTPAQPSHPVFCHFLNMVFVIFKFIYFIFFFMMCLSFDYPLIFLIFFIYNFVCIIQWDLVFCFVFSYRDFSMRAYFFQASLKGALMERGLIRERRAYFNYIQKVWLRVWFSLILFKHSILNKVRWCYLSGHHRTLWLRKSFFFVNE